MRCRWAAGHACLLKMKSPLYRQWVAYATVIAMLFGMIAPMAVCKCVDCNCPKSKTWLSGPATSEKCACLPRDKDCSTSNVPCECLCCDVQNVDKVALVAVLSTQKQNYSPSWDVVSVLPVDVAYGSGLPFSFGNSRILAPPHVSLHVLLCVFLNWWILGIGSLPKTAWKCPFHVMSCFRVQPKNLRQSATICGQR